MGEHSKDQVGHLARAWQWVSEHKRAILGALALALPLASRYVPGFPADEVLAVLRSFLGA